MGVKYRLVEWFIEQENRYNTGAARINMFLGLVGAYAIFELWMKERFDLIIDPKILIPAFIIYLLSLWLFGYIWDKTGCFIIQNEWGNKRNDFIREMRKKYNLPIPNGDNGKSGKGNGGRKGVQVSQNNIPKTIH